MDMKQLLNLCDRVLEEKNQDEAEDMVTIILDTYGKNIKNLDANLNCRQMSQIYHYSSYTDYLDDLKKLRDRLEKYLEINPDFFADDRLPSVDHRSINTSFYDLNIEIANVKMSVLHDEGRYGLNHNQLVKAIETIEFAVSNESSRSARWSKIKETVAWASAQDADTAAPVLMLASLIVNSSDLN